MSYSQNTLCYFHLLPAQSFLASPIFNHSGAISDHQPLPLLLASLEQCGSLIHTVNIAPLSLLLGITPVLFTYLSPLAQTSELGF